MHGGTDHLPSTKKGYSSFEYIKTVKRLNNAETFAWFKEHYPDIAKKDKGAHPKSKQVRRFFSLCLKDVELEEIDWLWQGWLAKGKLSLIVGDPEVGKTWLYLAIAAAVSNGGYLPGATEGVSKGKVMIFNAEDGKGDTILPRMNAIGVDADNVFLEAGVGTDEERPEHFSLGDDLKLIEDHLAQGDYRLLIFDPINSYMPKDTDSHKDVDVRTAIAPLAKIAERLGIAVICVMHLNKSAGTKAIYRVIGSIGYIGLARTALFVGEHPEKPELRIVDCIKNNIGQKPPPTAYSFHDGTFSWHEDDGVSATDVLTKPTGDQGTALEEAKTFLTALLLEGECEAKRAYADAQANCISKRTLDRAKKELKVKSVKKVDEDGTRWYWEFPESKVAKPSIDKQDGNLDSSANASQISAF